jgi:hypothetical protein
MDTNPRESAQSTELELGEIATIHDQDMFIAETATKLPRSTNASRLLEHYKEFGPIKAQHEGAGVWRLFFVSRENRNGAVARSRTMLFDGVSIELVIIKTSPKS